MIIQLKLNHPYVSELDRLLKKRQKQYPPYTIASLKQDRHPLRKLPPGSIPFSLKKTPSGTPPKSSH